MWDEGQHRIFGVDPAAFAVTPENVRALVHPGGLGTAAARDGAAVQGRRQAYQTEFRVRRPNGEIRWCIGTRRADRRCSRPCRARQRRHHRHHRSQGGRRAPGVAGARGRSPRQERAGAGAVDRSPDASQQHGGLTSRRWKAASRRCHARIRCCRSRAGKAPISAAWSMKSSRRSAPAIQTRSQCRARECCCSRPRRRRSRWRCTSLPPTLQNTARCPRASGKVKLVWNSRKAACRFIGPKPADRRRSQPASQGFGTRIDPGQHRRPAWRTGQFRLAAGRAASACCPSRSSDKLAGAEHRRATTPKSPPARQSRPTSQ